MARDKQFNMRLSDEEFQRLESLSKHYGLNPAALLRMLLKLETDSIANKSKQTK